MAFFNYLKNLVLDHLCGRTASLDVGDAVYVGLSTTAPVADGTNITEPSGNGYARVLIGNPAQSLTLKMGAASNGAITNAEAIMFPEATGAWGTITHFVFFSASTGGNKLGYGTLTSPISPISGDVPLFRTGELDWSIL